MPTPKGRNRKARRAAAVVVGQKPPENPEAAEAGSKTAGTAGAPGHEKQRRLEQRQEQLKKKEEAEAAAAAVVTDSPGKKGLIPEGQDGGKEGTSGARRADVKKIKKKKNKTPAAAGSGGDSIADLDADDFLSGGFMSMAGGSDDDDDNDTAEGAGAEAGGKSEGDDGSDGDDGNDADADDRGGLVGEDGSSDSEDDDANEMDLKGLAETDPEFFSFLQKEEPTLLEFDPMESDESEDEEGAGEGVGKEAGVEGGTGAAKSAAALLREASKGGGVPLTMALLQAMRQDAFEGKSTIQGVKRMIKAFRCGCHLGDESTEGKDGGGTVQQKFRIPSSEVYNDLMVCCLEGLHVAFMRLLFPGRDFTPPALTSPSADGSSKGSSNTAAAAGKRRRGEGTAGEQEEKGAAAAAAAGGEGGNGPVKKRGRKGDGKGESDGATASSAVGAGPGGTGGDTAGQIIAGAAAAASKGKGGGALARGTPRAAVVLTKDDFRAAALLPAWKAMQPALYSFFKSLLHVLEELHDRALLAFLLSRLEHYIPLLVPFPGLARGFLKGLLGLWGGAGAEAKGSGGGTEEESEDAERVRLLAYLRVRQMAAVLPFPFVEGCMKRLYLAFAKRARAPPASQAGKISLRVMEGCVVELYGMDVGSAYQNAFLYIRQLSLLLRRAMQHKTKDSIQSVRRWQVVTCLRVWTGVLAAAPGEDGLRTLIFPLAQVIEGIVRLSATLRHSPLVFQLVRMRQRLAAAAELYVPCSTPLLEVIRSPALFKKATASTGAPPNVPAILRLGKTQVDEGRAQGAVVEEALRLLGQEMDLYRYSAAFPELVIPVLGHLKKFAKLTKVSKWRMMSRGLIEVLEARGTWAAKRRLELRICPSDVEGLEELRPEGAPTMRERLGASEADVERVADDDTTAVPASKAAAATKGKQKQPKKNKKKPTQDDSEDEDDDGSEDDDDDDDDGDRGEEGTATKRKRSSTSSTTSRGGTPSADATAGDISPPDMVEDLSAWGDDDDEWA